MRSAQGGVPEGSGAVPEDVERGGGSLFSWHGGVRHKRCDWHRRHGRLVLEARALAASAESVGTMRVVSVVRDDLGMAEARTLVQRLVAEGVVAIVGLAGERAQLVMGRPEGVAVDCAAVLKEVLAKVGGRGGGQAGMAQGGLQDAESVAGAVAMIRGLLAGPAPSPPILAV